MDKTGSSNPEIEKPSRFGAGTYYIFGQGLIDIKTIIKKLKSYEKIIDHCMKKS
jgi:hypothetical protein